MTPSELLAFEVPSDQIESAPESALMRYRRELNHGFDYPAKTVITRHPQSGWAVVQTFGDSSYLLWYERPQDEGKYQGLYAEPPQTCPFCGVDTVADFVDNGVWLVQCGPYHCYECGATEMGPEDRDPSKLSFAENQTHYYRGENQHLTCAPTVAGILVGNHRVAKSLYDMGLLDLSREVSAEEFPF